MVKAIINSLASIAFPQNCHICGTSVESLENGVACESCWSRTRLISAYSALCLKCGYPMDELATRHSASCNRCTEQLYDRAVAAGVYELALAAVLLELKKTPYVPDRLNRLVRSALELLEISANTLILPVPLSAKRRVERGFNQAEVLARAVARLSGNHLDAFSLVRKIHTPMHRTAMDRKARESTVKNAFEIKRPKFIEGKSIILVDDIFTSGATVSSCASVLKKHGAASVSVLTLARAVEVRH